MVTLPLVHEALWERVARDFDDVGPEACMAEILDDLFAYNPHYLQMALRCARDIGDEQRSLTGFAMFYRILHLGACERGGVPPRITSETRDVIASLIGEFGDEQFVLLATETLHAENPCLLQMAESFASRHHDYLGIMQGFVMLYKTLSAQAVIDGLGIAAPRNDPPKGLPAPDR